MRLYFWWTSQTKKSGRMSRVFLHDVVYGCPISIPFVVKVLPGCFFEGLRWERKWRTKGWFTLVMQSDSLVIFHLQEILIIRCWYCNYRTSEDDCLHGDFDRRELNIILLLDENQMKLVTTLRFLSTTQTRRSNLVIFCQILLLISHVLSNKYFICKRIKKRQRQRTQVRIYG